MVSSQQRTFAAASWVSQCRYLPHTEGTAKNRVSIDEGYGSRRNLFVVLIYPLLMPVHPLPQSTPSDTGRPLFDASTLLFDGGTPITYKTLGVAAGARR